MSVALHCICICIISVLELPVITFEVRVAVELVAQSLGMDWEESGGVDAL